MTTEERFTHLVSLWLNNDYGTYSAIKDALIGGAVQSGSDLEEYVVDAHLANAFNDSGMAGDLMQYAVALIDWDELYSDLMESFGLNMTDEEAAQ